MQIQPFHIFLFIHLACLITGFGAVLVLDTFGLLWLLKKIPLSLVNKVAHVTQRLIWLGWFGMVASGLGLIIIKGYVDNLTVIKLFFVAMVGLNGVWLHFIKKSITNLGDNEPMPLLIKFRMFLATTISQTGWWGAILIGFVHRHIQHNIPWPANPWIYIFLIAGVFAVALAAGELALKKS